MIFITSITLQFKGAESDADWRAFLDWVDTEEKVLYQLRGYGKTPGEAAEDAYSKYKEDKEFYCEYTTPWE